MIVKLSRLFLLLIVVFVAAIYIPQYYWLGFATRTQYPMAFYSPVIQDFLLGHYDKKGYYYKDSSGKHYKRQEVDVLLPFNNYRLLAAKSRMPDSVNGIKIDLDEVRRNNLTMRVRAKDLDAPVLPLYPLFESRPPRLKLELPKNYFRINQRFEFITSETNRIDESLTAQFTLALKKKSFKFPAKGIFGNPTTRKGFDEGYFIVDAANQLFHVKKIHGKPYCAQVPVPKDLRIKSIIVKENDLREQYGLLIAENSDLYYIMYDHYRLQKLPVKNYDWSKDQLIVLSDLFYRVFNVLSDTTLNSVVTDRNYKPIRTYSESWPGTEQSLAGRISRYIFPFSLDLTKSTSRFVDFYFEGYHTQALFANILFVLLTLGLMKKRNVHIPRKWYDLLLVLITGIYGFLAVLIFENTDN